MPGRWGQCRSVVACLEASVAVAAAREGAVQVAPALVQGRRAELVLLPAVLLRVDHVAGPLLPARR